MSAKFRYIHTSIWKDYNLDFFPPLNDNNNNKIEKIWVEIKFIDWLQKWPLWLIKHTKKNPDIAFESIFISLWFENVSTWLPNGMSKYGIYIYTRSNAFARLYVERIRDSNPFQYFIITIMVIIISIWEPIKNYVCFMDIYICLYCV